MSFNRRKLKQITFQEPVKSFDGFEIDGITYTTLGTVNGLVYTLNQNTRIQNDKNTLNIDEVVLLEYNKIKDKNWVNKNNTVLIDNTQYEIAHWENIAKQDRYYSILLREWK